MPASQETKAVDLWVLRRAWAGVVLTGVLSLFAVGAIWLDAVSDSYMPLQPSLFLSLSVLAAVWLVASTPNVPDGPSPWAQQVCAVVLALLAAILLTATLGFVWTTIASVEPGGPFLGAATTSGSIATSAFPGPNFIKTGGPVMMSSQTSSAQLAQVITALAGGFPAAMAFWWAVVRLKELGDEFKGWIAGAVGIVLIMILSLVSSHPQIYPMPYQALPGASSPSAPQQGSSGSGTMMPGFGGFGNAQPQSTDNNP